jgi:DNA-directed RNA polymerase specialized sigma24 family protein
MFEVLLHKLPEFQYDRQKSFRSWLRTVTMNKWKERGRRRTEHAVWRDRGKIWPICGFESRISDALTGFAASAHILSVKAPFQRRQQILT